MRPGLRVGGRAISLVCAVVAWAKAVWAKSWAKAVLSRARAAVGVRTLFRARTACRAFVGPAISLFACCLAASGIVPDLNAERPTALGVASVAILVLVVANSVAARLRFVSPSARAQRASLISRSALTVADLDVGLALVAAVYCLVGLTGYVQSPLHPLAYLLVAFAATFFSGNVAAAVLIASLAQETAMTVGVAASAGAAGAGAGTGIGTGIGIGTGAVAWSELAEHVAFLLLAALAHFAFLRGLVIRQRLEHERCLREELAATREEAREFRIIAAALGADSRAPRPREEEEQCLAAGAVEMLHASMFYVLELLKKSLDLQTCVLLWLEESGERLKIKELVTDSDVIVENAVPASAGALGAIVRDRIILNLAQPKRGHLPYYAGPETVGAFLGIPVEEAGHLRGVLCADRRSDKPFTARDEALLLGASQQILREIQNERVFCAVERSKYEHERFFRASAMLGRALTPEEVMDTAITAAADIVGFELAVITQFERDKKRHSVCRVKLADGASSLVDREALEGLEYRDNAGLVAMVVKNKHYLPAGGEVRDQTAPVFTAKVKLKGVSSLLVLPLVCADEAIGTFVLASKRHHAFPKDKRDLLGVIANQVAVSFMNAKMYRQMEMMATTDGLTGLLNHRTFQDRLTEMLNRAERHRLKLALIFTDIDHFKKVNDTYGHPVGDQVLRGVARVLVESVRKIDAVARYGGEEFAVVIEGADESGAYNLAERIRLDVEKQVFQSEQGALNVTLSLGIAAVPDDAKDKQALIDRADQALYHAKHGGRNRSMTYQQLLADKAQKAQRRRVA
ncbi:MAG: diguanylate cyclase [Pseudomonadota bacterium]